MHLWIISIFLRKVHPKCKFATWTGIFRTDTKFVGVGERSILHIETESCNGFWFIPLGKGAPNSWGHCPWEPWNKRPPFEWNDARRNQRYRQFCCHHQIRRKVKRKCNILSSSTNLRFKNVEGRASDNINWRCRWLLTYQTFNLLVGYLGLCNRFPN